MGFDDKKLRQLFIYPIMILLLTSLVVGSFPVNAAESNGINNDQKITSASAKEAIAKAAPRFNSEVTNGILTIELTTGGQYSVRTGALHPYPNERLLYPVGTGYDTIRSVTSGTDYILGNLGAGTSLGGIANIEQIGTTGYKISYVVTNPDTLTINRTILIHGTTVDDSWVEVTTQVTNTGNNNEQIKARYFWDLTIGGSAPITFDDGPIFRQRNPDASADFSSHNFISPAFEYWDYQSKNSVINLKASGTASGPSQYDPTTPQRLSYNPWPSAYGTTYDYSTPDGTDLSHDSSALLYFGDQTPFTILPGHSKTITAAIFNANAPSPGEIDGFKWNDTNGNGIFDNGEVGMANVQICATRTDANNNAIAPPVCALTDVNGTYSLTSMLPGFYKVAETPVPGMLQTFPPNNQPHFVVLPSGGNLTGVNFGNTPGNPGSISGIKFNDTNGDGIWQNQTEPGVPNVQIKLLQTLSSTQTDQNGNYSFTNLPPGNYTVFETLPQGKINTTPLFQRVHVGPGENVTNINFGNEPIAPPPPEVGVRNQTWTFNGLPVVYWGTPQTFTKNASAHCGGDTPVAMEAYVTFLESGHVRHKAATLTNPDHHIWSVTFNPFEFPGDGSSTTDHGNIHLIFLVDCSPATPGWPPAGPNDLGALDGDDQVNDGGTIYVDPSGHIVDDHGMVVSGATVTILKESPPGTGNYIVPNSTDLIPTTNPQTTGPDGSYGWVVVPGTWKVSASKLGYTSNESSPLTIPPAVTNLNITLGLQTYCGKTIDEFDTVIEGTVNDDVLVGTNGNDLMQGIAGDDRLFGKAGSDCIMAGDGNNYISGIPGFNDTVIAGNGNNKIWTANNDVPGTSITVGNGTNRIVTSAPTAGPGPTITLGTGNNIVWIKNTGAGAGATITGGGGFNICVLKDPTFGYTLSACNLVYHH